MKIGLCALFALLAQYLAGGDKWLSQVMMITHAGMTTEAFEDSVKEWLATAKDPIAAFGNSDGDLEMLQWTDANVREHFCLYVYHTDAEREYAYDRQSKVGKLDKGLDAAAARGWTVVDMKSDWKTIFPASVK